MKFLKLSKKNIELLISSLAVNLIVAFLFTTKAETNKLTLFSNALLIIGLIHLAIGAINLNRLHGDFDGISYFFAKGTRNITGQERNLDFETYQAQREEVRGETANIPLYSGIICVAICFFITYVL